MAEARSFERRVTINVGGTTFETSFTTLTKYDDSMFSALVADRWQKQEELFIDRNPTYFAKVLDYLRDGEHVVLPEDDNSLKCLCREAEFYNLPGLVEICSAKLQENWNKHTSHGERIKINVGGTLFETSFSTVTRVKDSVLFTMATECWQKNEELFIDRDSTHFAEVLNYLRNEDFIPSVDVEARESLGREAEFYNLPVLAEMCLHRPFHLDAEVKWRKCAVKAFHLKCLSYRVRYNCRVCNSELCLPSTDFVAAVEIEDVGFAYWEPLRYHRTSAKGRVLEANDTCCVVKWDDGEVIHTPKSALCLAIKR